jgi:thioredoxin-related protein/uncharacterized membrane protein YphA (DoxX/SURF4 family)
MDILLLLCRLLLAGVFGAAGAAKLADRDGTVKVVGEFGLPTPLARPVSLLLPLAELVAAVLLITTTAAWWGALGALTLLLLFTAGIAVNLARGRKPDCHCFGQLHSAPVGRSTLLRNVLFAAGAGFIVWQGRGNSGPGVLGLAGDLISNHTVAVIFAAPLIVTVAVEGWLIFHLFRQQGRLLLRIDNLELRLDVSGVAPAPTLNQMSKGLPMGSGAPPFELPLLSGGKRTLDGLRQGGKPLLLIFSDPDCSPCNALMPDVANWESKHQSKLTVALMSRNAAETKQAQAGYELKNVLIQQGREIAEKYQAQATPSAVLIHPDGSIGSHLAVGSQAIAELVSSVTGEAMPRALPLAAGNGHHQSEHHRHTASVGLEVGEPAPPFRLPSLGGDVIEHVELRGRETLVLFWNPNCGFCNKMLPDLKAWESSRLEPVPELLVISTGTDEANRAMGLKSTVVLDQEFSVGRSFGVGGTPSAVIVDAQGRIASAVAVGAAAVFALAASEPAWVSASGQRAGQLSV